MNRRCQVLPALVLVCLYAGAAEPASVVESARKIPVAYEVDIVVVGGSTAAVAAAVAAADTGAKVFLAAPRAYLGDDTAGTLRLWLEPGQVPVSALAKKLFTERREAIPLSALEAKLPIKYEADKPSAGGHKDKTPPSILTDGLWGSAASESVQYSGDVNITVELQSEAAPTKAYVMVYHRKDFLVHSVTFYASSDKKSWRQVAVVKNDAPAQESDYNSSALMLSALVEGKPKYLRFLVRNSPGSGRVLVGEIAVVGPAPPGQAAPRPHMAVVRPLHIKRTLDQALLSAGVEYLYGCYATDVLRDRAGQPAGIAMANRAGRQAVVAKVIVDATDRAWVARMAGARFRPFPSGPQTFKRVVVGGQVQAGTNVSARQIHPPFTRGSHTYGITEYTLRIPMQDGTYASWAAAEQAARDLTYHPDQQFASDTLFDVPPDSMHGRRRGSGEWRGVEHLDIQAFRPDNVERLFVLGGCADIPRAHAAKLLQPLAFIDMGARVGAAAGTQAKALPPAGDVTLPGSTAAGSVKAQVREFLAGVRSGQKLPSIAQHERPLPVLGSYDVVVIGGGTSGAPAGIAAARQGARTLVVECLHGLGGVGTLGAISNYYYGNRVGFTKEVPGLRTWGIEQRMEWWRTALRNAGADIWFGALGCGAVVDRGRVVGVVVATPEGRGLVRAKAVVDATGNADIAAAAGAPCMYTDGTDIALQGTGLPPRQLGRNYTNTDFTIVDETDMMDVWHVFVYTKLKAGNAFDIGQLLDTRERRRIVGDFTISVLDQLNKRTYPDTVVEAYSNFDTHGYTVHPYFTLAAPDTKGWRTHIPYRALLPKGLDGMLVVGLGISAHRDAVPVIRMQPDIQNGGYAAGVAAAMAAKCGVSPRRIDVRALQQHLVRVGNLPESVLADKDSYPMSPEQIAAAVDAAKDGCRGAAVILAHPTQALPLLRRAHASAETQEHRLAYAQVLAVLGDATGLPALIAHVDAAEDWDAGWRFKAGGQFGSNVSRLDSLIYAMSRTRDRRAVPAIVAKVKRLDADHAFSHHRAAALALEAIADPSAAGPLAELLAKPGLRGHAVTHIDQALEREKQSLGWGALAPRRNALRELMLARALYLCGDKDGLGKSILDEYSRDLRGHFARHAQAVAACVEPPGG